jgi:uncharacterized protein YndB with AHSA1/START domain
MTDLVAFSCDQFIPHPPATVWRALTEPELIGQWWAAGDVQPVVGHTFTLDMGAWGEQPCQVVAVEPDRMISYTFAWGTLDTTLTRRLVPEGSGTRLLLEQAGFDLDSPFGRQAYEGMGEGWPSVIARMDEVLRQV